MSTFTLPRFSPEQLMERGYTRYLIHKDLVMAAREECLAILKAYRHLPPEERAFTRKDEDEPDLGLICKDGEHGTDVKCYFHFAVDLLEPGANGLRGYPMKSIAALYHANNRAAAEIAEQMNSAYPDLFPESIIDELAKAGLYPKPYATNVLRTVYYPIKTGGDQRQGTKAHFDRSFLTQHFGGIGGDLLVFSDRDDQSGKPISLHLGEALVFFGVKAFLHTKGAVKALRHGSQTGPGEERYALVQFGHIDLDVIVKDADESLRQFVEA